ncbi:MAG TPA: hypothetical protein VNI84_13405 [Pyrinomonadaceae bacterium]|nr:hypothetical protein [Pyrinomonadaceae bacterium]
MKTRATRRLKSDKYKHRVKALIRSRFSSSHLADDATYVGKLAQTRKPCSCWMCGNPRKWHKQKTLKELKQVEVFKQFTE